MTEHAIRRQRVAVLLMVVALFVAACGAGGEDEESAEDGDAGGDDSVSGTATLLSAYSEPDDIAGIDDLVAAFAARYPDAELTHESAPSADDLRTRVAAGDPPQLLLAPPGVLPGLHEQGALVALDELVDVDTLESEYLPGALRSGMVGDDLVGLPVRLGVESLVWYRSDVFAEQGYEVPETWDDLLALSDQIRGDVGAMGMAPWCLGLEDGAASGATLTDWIEDVMLRLHGGEVYDRWVGHDVTFDSPEVRQAFEQVAQVWFTEGNVLGDPQNIAQTNVEAAAAPMFEDPPACLLHRQGGGIRTSFPDNAEVGGNVDVFALPPIGDGTGEQALLLSGDVLSVTEDSALTRAFARFVASAEGQEAWARAGAMMCANASCSPDAPSDDTISRQRTLLEDAAVTRFDASELMPPDVGAGAFAAAGTAWVAGERKLGATLRAIDGAWPQGACGVSGVGPNC